MIPTIFIHFGNCEYAPAVIAQAKARGNEVVFLNPPADAVTTHPFARSYVHMSTNHFQFELACIVRWFYLRDWLDAHQIPDVLYCDTDVLLFANVESEIHSDPYYHACDFTLSVGSSGHTSFWKIGALRQFCAFLEVTYDLKVSIYRELQRIYADMRAQGLAGGVSDMLLLKLFAAQSGLAVGEMSAVRNGAIWDHNFNASDEFEMERYHKRIFFLDNEPWAYPWQANASRVRFRSLHMQGNAKKLIPEYAIDAERIPT